MANERRRMGGRGQMPVEKAKDFKGSIGKLFAYMKQYHAAVAVVILCAIASTVFSVIGPDILGKATTELSNGLLAKIQGTGSIDFTKIGQILLFVLGLYLLSTLFSFVQGWLMTGVTQKVCYRMRKDISEKIDRMPMAYFESRTYGEVLSRITNDVDTLGQSLNQSITQIITSVATMVGVLVMMLRISPLMTLIAVVILPISVTLISLVVKKSQKYFKQQQEYLGHINGQVEETYAGHTVIQAYNKEKDMVQQFQETNDTLYHSAWKSQFLSGLMMPLTNLIGNIGYVGVCILGGYLTIHGEIAVGDIQSFITYTRNFTQPISQISQSMNMLQSTAAAAERVFEFLASEEEVAEVENPVVFEDVQGQVTFENVCFGYDPSKIVINDFSMYIKPGQTTAIVGPTGAGKTTIVKLLMRFYELNAGAIYIDGHNITDYTRSGLRNMVGMVLQDAWLFEGSILENLRFGRPNATDEEVMKAAKAAHVDHFIRTLDHGYDTVLNEASSNISQGQRQLLTIARAFLADPKILILDEATSSVDTRTEVLIQKGMDELMKGRTSFVIAHRLSTIRDADNIIVMDHGDIVEVGSHDELMKRNGFYTKLYNAQFEEA